MDGDYERGPLTMVSWAVSNTVGCLRTHWYVTIFLILPFAIKLYTKLTTKRCRSKRMLHGRVAIVTGSNTGIGLETARDLAKRHAKVILACRDETKAKAAKASITRSMKDANVIVKKLDVSSMTSIREFCKEFIRDNYRLDILVNNAAVFDLKFKILTEDKLEKQMATNYFGPFLLTHLLIDIMKNTPGSRVVNLSSVSHKLPNLDLENLNAEKYYLGMRIYNVSKLLILIFTNELSRRLKGTGVTCNSVHPGVVQTNLLSAAPPFFKFFLNFMAITTEEGAQTPIYAAVSEEMENVTGKYLVDCKVAGTSAMARDRELARKLWSISEEMVQLRQEERIKES